ncbi:MAG: alpha/beta hydrolase [Chlorobi bacterium]|nr:alpha/beta hydrolase [Chlorobiota bacterium]
MMNFRDNLIRYKDSGSGNVIVLLHGYLESLNVWDDFALSLVEKYRVIRIDLPGHGKSGCISEIHSMDLMADVVQAVLQQCGVNKCFLIGHSMGGYVTLSFLEMYPHLLSGFCLLHSSPFADSIEKKKNREREIELVKAGKANIIYNEHVPKTFAPENVGFFKKEIEKGIEIAKKTPPEGIIAALNGMKTRLDKTAVLKSTSLPFLYFIGLKDNFISSDILSRINLPQKNYIVLLEKSGHMGFIEEKERCLQEIESFI